jgi:hypothetical protein
MVNNILSVREIVKDDIPLLIDYWLSANDAFLTGMGADINKIKTILFF